MLLAGALAAAYLGLVWLALRQAQHFAAVCLASGTHRGAGSARGAPPAALRRRLALQGCGALLCGAVLSFWGEGPGFGSLLWVQLLGAAGVAVTFTLTWRPRWLRWLLPRQPQRPAG